MLLPMDRVVEGAVNVPADIVRIFATSALLAAKSLVPAPVTVRL
jgi:hypothetical protein